MSTTSSISLTQIASLGALSSVGGFVGNTLLNNESTTSEVVSNETIIPKEEVKPGKSKDSFENVNAVVFGADSLDSKYEGKLLGLTKKSHLLSLVKPTWEEGDDWWNKVYKTRFAKPNQENSIFSSVRKGYSPNFDPTALNHACDTAYTQDRNAFEDLALLKHISIYCVDSETPLDISEPESTTYTKDDAINTEYKFGVLSIEENKPKLIKIIDEKNNDNELWWNWAYRNLLKGKNSNTTLTFKELEVGYSNIDSYKSLNNACNQAYKKVGDELEEENNKLLDEIKKFCSPYKDFTLQLPTIEPEVKDEPVKNLSTFSDEDLKGDYTKESVLGTIKKENLDYLVKSEKNNRDWWRWSYQNQKKYLTKTESYTLHKHFENVSRGYSDTNETALNKVCDTAYKKTQESDDTNDFDNLLKNIGLFCAKGKDAVDISEPNAKTYDKPDKDAYRWGVFGLKENYPYLVKTSSTKEENNENWWKWALKNKFKSGDTVHSTFKSVKEGYAENSSNPKAEIALNQACNAAYKLTVEDWSKEDSKKLFENIKDFCALSKSSSFLKLPSKPTTFKLLKDSDKLKTEYNKGLSSVKNNKDNLLDPDNTINQDIWEWNFEKNFKKWKKGKASDLQTGFEKVSIAYANTDNSLNKACKKSYTISNGDISDYDVLKSNVQELCTNNTRAFLD